ncbi:MAG: hypothetical protein DMF68_21340 [Acidobacteria bacterium]|nr:MAG: hypothetical protein DMF68_21340 [Acidobacteriota bacterium]
MLTIPASNSNNEQLAQTADTLQDSNADSLLALLNIKTDFAPLYESFNTDKNSVSTVETTDDAQTAQSVASTISASQTAGISNAISLAHATASARVIATELRQATEKETANATAETHLWSDVESTSDSAEKIAEKRDAQDAADINKTEYDARITKASFQPAADKPSGLVARVESNKDNRLDHAQIVSRTKQIDYTVKALALSPTLLAPLPAGQTITIQGAGSGFTLPAGKTVTITFQVTLNNPPNLSGPSNPKVSTQGTLQGSFTGSPLTTDDPSVGGTNDATVTNVDLFNSTTTVSSSSPTSNSSQSVTLTATIGTTGSPAPPGGTNRTGTVAFYDGSIAPAHIISGCGAVAVASNQAQCTTAALSNGPHSINAAYTGDGNFDPSDTTGSAITQTVSKSGTTTTVGSSGTPSLLSQSVTYTATVASQTSVTGPPTGTVIFKDGGTTISGCSSVSLSSGQAQCITTPSTGAHSITAFYNGDDTNNRFSASDNTASPFTQQVNQSGATVTVASSLNPSLASQSVTFTATVGSNTAVAGPPTGTIQFRDGVSGTGTAIGSPVALTTGGVGCPAGKSCASITTSTLSATTHTITADYNGDTNFSATSGTLSGGQVVNKSGTATALGSSSNPVAPSTNVDFTATVTSQTAVTGPPSGTVTFYDGTVQSGNEISGCAASTLNGSGVATCTTSFPTQSTHTITAVYNGDDSSARFNASTSNAVSQRVGTCTASVEVTNTSDGGAGSLRDAIGGVCTGGTITFNIPTGDPGFSGGVYTIKLTTGELALSDSVTITGLGASALTVSGENTSRVFNVASGKTVAISGMTITKGKAANGADSNTSAAAGDGNQGGAIINNGTLTLTNVVVSSSNAGNGGNNTSTGVGGNGGGGGGIFNAPSATLNITNSTISGNQSGTNGTGASAGEGGPGGGIYSLGNLTINGSTFNGNKAVGLFAEGGGIDSEGGTLIINNSTISGNTSDGQGGGLLNCGTTTGTLTSVTITGNIADNDNDTNGVGGGIAQVSSNMLTLRNTIVAGNFKGTSGGTKQVETATVVGTIGAAGAGNAKVVVTAAGMTGNPKTILVAVANNDTASDVAGKMRAALIADPDIGDPTTGFFTVTGSADQIVLTAKTAAANDPTMNIETDNDSGAGGSTGLTPEPTSANTTAGVAPSSSDDIFASGPGGIDAASSYNLIGDAATSGGLTNANHNIVGAIVANVLNTTLADNGGPTKTHALVASSPALEAGNAFGLTTDQRGFSRPVNSDGTPPSAGDDSDIGAYEQQLKPGAPNAPVLDPASDTGAKEGHITSSTSPTFNISGVISGAKVELLRDTDPATTKTVVAFGTASGTTISLTDPSVSNGNYSYTARQTIGGTTPSDESAALSITISSTAPAAPSTPDLQPGSDSGVNTDNITNITPRVFDVQTTETGATVELLRDGTVVDTKTGDSTQTIQLTDSAVLSDNTYSYATRQTNAVATTPSASALNVTIDTTPPTAPSTPDLQATSDSGVNNDNITNKTTRVFDVAGTTTGVTVELYRGVTLVDSTSGNGATVQLTDSTSPADGTYNYTARQVDGAGNASSNSAPLSVTIDTTTTASVPDLQAASDSGASNTDNITNKTPRVFDITNTETGATVELLRDDDGAGPNPPVVVNSTTGNGATVQLTDPAALADGPHDYLTRQTDVAGNVNTSSALTVTIDTTPAVPSAPDLQAASDTGASQTDDRTGATPRVFDVQTTETGALVELLRNGTAIDSKTGDSAPIQLTDSASLPDGTYTYSTRQTDVAGNVAASSITLSVTIDTTAPSVSSITRVDANPTNAQTVHFTVTFSEAVTGVDAADFAVTTTGSVTGTSVTNVTPVDASHYTVTVDTGNGDGSVRLDFVNDNSVKDVMNLSPTGNFTAGEVYTVSKSDPFVVSIKRANSNPTNLGSVDFTVTFSKPVTGVDTTDFALTVNSLTSTSVTNVTPVDSSHYTVTVNTGSGDGTLRLDLIDDDSIVDTGGRKLGGTGTGNGNFTSGEVYTIDKTKPSVSVAKASGQADPVTGPTNTTVINFTVTFNEAVTGFDSADVSISGTANATVANVSQVAPNDGTTYNVGIEGMTSSGAVTITIPANAAFDLAGNGNTSTGPSNTATVTFNKDNSTAFVVNTTADTDDGSCDPLGTGTGNKDCTLREAINAANADAGAETISFDPTVFASPGPYTINLTSALPDLASDMTINGPGANVLSVKRNTGGNYRIFTIPSGNNNVTINGLTISNGNSVGSSPDGEGGGIRNASSGTVNVTNSTISGNAAGAQGGGIFRSGIGALNVTNSTISGNTSDQGGGLATTSSGTVSITNSTISGNTANANAGGVFISNATIAFTGSTITNNRTDNDNNGSGSGGGIDSVSGTVTLKNTIVAGNFKGPSPSTTADDIFGTVDAASSFSLIGTGGSGGLVNATNSNQVGVPDAGLKPLADNGGPTKTHALQCTSPAIDKGNSFTLTTDQRGLKRVFDLADSVYPNAAGGDGTDIGAYESQSGGGCVPLAIAPNPQPSTNEDTAVIVTMTGTFSQNTPLTFTVTQQPSHGALSNQASPNCSFDAGTSTNTCTATIQYKPSLNYNGADLFKFKVSAPVGGGTLDSEDAEVDITVNAVNDAPVTGARRL